MIEFSIIIRLSWKVSFCLRDRANETRTHVYIHQTQHTLPSPDVYRGTHIKTFFFSTKVFLSFIREWAENRINWYNHFVIARLIQSIAFWSIEKFFNLFELDRWWWWWWFFCENGNSTHLIWPAQHTYTTQNF